MHGVDWNAVQARSLKLVDSAANRADVNYIISEMVSDINSSHTYVWGGDEAGRTGPGLRAAGLRLRADAGREGNVRAGASAKSCTARPGSWMRAARSICRAFGCQRRRLPAGGQRQAGGPGAGTVRCAVRHRGSPDGAAAVRERRRRTAASARCWSPRLATTANCACAAGSRRRASTSTSNSGGKTRLHLRPRYGRRGRGGLRAPVPRPARAGRA